MNQYKILLCDSENVVLKTMECTEDLLGTSILTYQGKSFTYSHYSVTDKGFIYLEANPVEIK